MVAVRQRVIEDYYSVVCSMEALGGEGETERTVRDGQELLFEQGKACRACPDVNNSGSNSECTVTDFELDMDVDMLQFEGLPDLPTFDVYEVEFDPQEAGPPAPLDRMTRLDIPGMRDEPDPGLVAAGEGRARRRSAHNERWSVKRADQLRRGLKWDMSIPFEDLSLDQLNDLLSNLFARVTKYNKELYPSSSIKNLMNSFSRVIRNAHLKKALNGGVAAVDKHFNIKNHPAFLRTAEVINVAIQKSAGEGVNQKTKKVIFSFEC
jgi:hypothetical protein